MTIEGLLAIGEVATRTGLTIRALRHYESFGLLKPVRTEHGRRMYGPRELERLHQVETLKRAGCTLRHIAALVARQRVESVDLLDAQIETLARAQAEIVQVLGELRHARALLSRGESLDLGGLCRLIRQGRHDMTQDAMKPVLDRYFTAEDQETWKATGEEHFTPGLQEEYQDKWRGLIVRIEAAMADGTDPASARARDLLEEWNALLEPLRATMGDAMLRKTGQMYAEMGQWAPQEQAAAPFRPEVFAFMQAVARA